MSTVIPPKPQSKSAVVVNFKANERVKTISDFPKLPAELKLLIFLQKSTFIFSLALITSALTIFGLTVRIPQAWDLEYKKLKTLQRQERQLIATNEIERKKLIQQTETQSNNLVYPQPEHALFLSISPTTDNRELTTQESKPATTMSVGNDSPLAY
jgi:hypothetical protein